MAEERIIKSFEEADNDVFGDILSEKRKKEDVKIGLFTGGYFEYWRMYPETLQKNVESDMERVRANFKKSFKSVVCSETVDTLDAAENAAKLFKAEDIDILVVAYGTYMPDFMTLHVINQLKNVPVIFFSVQNGEVIDRTSGYEHSLRNSSTIGIAQITGTMRKLGRDYKIVVGSIDDERAYKKIGTYVKAAQAVKDISEANIGVIGNVFRGMYDLELSKTFLKSTFDVNVIYIQSGHLLAEWEQVLDDEVKVVSDKLLARFKKRDVTENDVHRAIKLAIAMQRLAERFRLDAMCFLDQHFVQKQTLTTARMGASLLMENTDLTVACEGDLGGLVTMMLMKSISGSHSLMAEWGEYDTELNSCLVMGHGIGVPELAKSDADITLTRTPEEWGFEGGGLNYELIVKPGAVTIGHVIETTKGYKMIVSPAESVDIPALPYNELHAMVKVKTPIKEYLEKVLDSGVTHHCIVGLTDMSQELLAVAELLKLDTFYID